MKYVFASDIHGSSYWAGRLLEKFDACGAEKLILLGDQLYHGARNDLTKEYDTKKTAALLNAYRDRICAVRGNCDSEVDQMVLDFPIMADYAMLELNGIGFLATHGHLWDPDHLPPMRAGEAFVYGHVHLPVAERRGDVFILNPGSVALPKGGNPESYAVLEDSTFRILSFEDEVIREITLRI